MKKLILILSYILILNSVDAKEKFTGKIIKQDETIEVTFLIDKNYRTGSMMESFSKIHNEVEYIDANNDKKILLPEDCIEIQFTDENGNLARFVSIENVAYDPEKPKLRKYTGCPKLLLELVVDGKYKLYNFYGMLATSFMTHGPFAKGVAYHILETETSYHVISYSGSRSNMSFVDGSKMNSNSFSSPSKKDIAKIFNSCSDLSTKIMSGELKNKDFAQIVEFFNTNCNPGSTINPESESK